MLFKVSSISFVFLNIEVNKILNVYFTCVNENFLIPLFCIDNVISSSSFKNIGIKALAYKFCLPTAVKPGTAEIPLPYKFGQTKLYPDETFEDFNGIFQLWTYEYTDEYKEKLYRDFIARKSKG